jgi:hypothetical protein
MKGAVTATEQPPERVLSLQEQLLTKNSFHATAFSGLAEAFRLTSQLLDILSLGSSSLKPGTVRSFPAGSHKKRSESQMHPFSSSCALRNISTVQIHLFTQKDMICNTVSVKDKKAGQKRG